MPETSKFEESVIEKLAKLEVNEKERFLGMMEAALEKTLREYPENAVVENEELDEFGCKTLAEYVEYLRNMKVEPEYKDDRFEVCNDKAEILYERLKSLKLLNGLDLVNMGSFVTFGGIKRLACYIPREKVEEALKESPDSVFSFVEKDFQKMLSSSLSGKENNRRFFSRFLLNLKELKAKVSQHQESINTSAKERYSSKPEDYGSYNLKTDNATRGEFNVKGAQVYYSEVIGRAHAAHRIPIEDSFFIGVPTSDVDNNPATTMKHHIRDVNKRMHEAYRKKQYIDGSTALLVHCSANKDGATTITTANLGDSRAVLLRRDKSGALSFQRLTDDHACNDYLEMSRAEAAGEAIFIDDGGHYRMAGTRVNMPRALADFSSPGMSDEPDIASTQITKDEDDGAQYFLIASCDGLFDAQFSGNPPVSECYYIAPLEEWFRNQVLRDKYENNMADFLKDVARERFMGGDDITVAVCEIPPKESVMIGIFDGHGGGKVASTAATTIGDSLLSPNPAERVIHVNGELIDISEFPQAPAPAPASESAASAHGAVTTHASTITTAGGTPSATTDAALVERAINLMRRTKDIIKAAQASQAAEGEVFRNWYEQWKKDHLPPVDSSAGKPSGTITRISRRLPGAVREDALKVRNNPFLEPTTEFQLVMAPLLGDDEPTAAELEVLRLYLAQRPEVVRTIDEDFPGVLALQAEWRKSFAERKAGAAAPGDGAPGRGGGAVRTAAATSPASDAITDLGEYEGIESNALPLTTDGIGRASEPPIVPSPPLPEENNIIAGIERLLRIDHEEYLKESADSYVSQWCMNDKSLIVLPRAFLVNGALKTEDTKQSLATARRVVTSRRRDLGSKKVYAVVNHCGTHWDFVDVASGELVENNGGGDDACAAYTLIGIIARDRTLQENVGAVFNKMRDFEAERPDFKSELNPEGDAYLKIKKSFKDPKSFPPERLDPGHARLFVAAAMLCNNNLRDFYSVAQVATRSVAIDNQNLRDACMGLGIQCLEVSELEQQDFEEYKKERICGDQGILGEGAEARFGDFWVRLMDLLKIEVEQDKLQELLQRHFSDRVHDNPTETNNLNDGLTASEGGVLGHKDAYSDKNQQDTPKEATGKKRVGFASKVAEAAANVKAGSSIENIGKASTPPRASKPPRVFEFSSVPKPSTSVAAPKRMELVDDFNLVGDHTTLTHYNVNILMRLSFEKARMDYGQLSRDNAVDVCVINDDPRENLDLDLSDAVLKFIAGDQDKASIALCRGRIINNRITGDTHWTGLHLRKVDAGGGRWSLQAYTMDSMGNEVPQAVDRILRSLNREEGGIVASGDFMSTNAYHAAIAKIQSLNPVSSDAIPCPKQKDGYSCGYHTVFNLVGAHSAEDLQDKILQDGYEVDVERFIEARKIDLMEIFGVAALRNDIIKKLKKRGAGGADATSPDSSDDIGAGVDELFRIMDNKDTDYAQKLRALSEFCQQHSSLHEYVQLCCRRIMKDFSEVYLMQAREIEGDEPLAKKLKDICDKVLRVQFSNVEESAGSIAGLIVSIRVNDLGSLNSIDRGLEVILMEEDGRLEGNGHDNESDNISVVSEDGDLDFGDLDEKQQDTSKKATEKKRVRFASEVAEDLTRRGRHDADSEKLSQRQFSDRVHDNPTETNNLNDGSPTAPKGGSLNHEDVLDSKDSEKTFDYEVRGGDVVLKYTDRRSRNVAEESLEKDDKRWKLKNGDVEVDEDRFKKDWMTYYFKKKDRETEKSGRKAGMERAGIKEEDLNTEIPKTAIQVLQIRALQSERKRQSTTTSS